MDLKKIVEDPGILQPEILTFAIHARTLPELAQEVSQYSFRTLIMSV
jgi:hypothetical protein